MALTSTFRSYCSVFSREVSFAWTGIHIITNTASDICTLNRESFCQKYISNRSWIVVYLDSYEVMKHSHTAQGWRERWSSAASWDFYSSLCCETCAHTPAWTPGCLHIDIPCGYKVCHDQSQSQYLTMKCIVLQPIDAKWTKETKLYIINAI